MKKIFKVMALTIGIMSAAAFTSFADGWTKENNQWVYYQNGSKICNDWKTGADGSYFYLGNNGNMVTNSFIDGERYVDSDGKMVTNTWRQIDSKWYFFDNNGKMIKSRSKQINSNWYFFDDMGEMQTGWVYDNGDWYYCDANAGGRMLTNTWRNIEPDPEMIYDESSSSFYPEDNKFWFYFMSTGKVCKAESSGRYREIMINDHRYAFDEFGRMQTGWVKLEDKTPQIAGYKYYNDSSNIGVYGAAHQGWLSAYPPEEQGFGTDVQWFYFGSNGVPYYGSDVSNGGEDEEVLEAKFKRLDKNGKSMTYLFNEYGNPVHGLRKVRRSNGVVTSMYFGTKQESCLQLGDKTITDANGETKTFYFDSRGYGYNGVKNGKLYYMGLLQKAVDSSFAYYQLPGSSDIWLVSKSGNIVKNKNIKTKEDYVDYQSDAQGKKGPKATEDVSELIEPAFEVSYI